MSEAAKSNINAPIKVSWKEIGQNLKDKFNCFPQPLIVSSNPSDNGIETILLKDQNQLIDLMRELKQKHNFSVLLLINAVEYKDSFQLIYQLQKMPPDYQILAIKLNISKENPEAPSLVELWSSANWYERELWDLQGIKFQGHSNLKRILNPEAWEGFPMRKDYIPPIDALNGPITAVKGETIGKLSKSIRTDVEIIDEPNQKVDQENASA